MSLPKSLALPRLAQAIVVKRGFQTTSARPAGSLEYWVIIVLDE
jgi:hypothetical protein